MVNADSIGHIVMLISNWSSDLLICTDGEDIISHEDKKKFKSEGFGYNESVISEMTGSDDVVESLVF